MLRLIYGLSEDDRRLFEDRVERPRNDEAPRSDAEHMKAMRRRNRLRRQYDEGRRATR